jgi:hypothetical protein
VNGYNKGHLKTEGRPWRIRAGVNFHHDVIARLEVEIDLRCRVQSRVYVPGIQEGVFVQMFGDLSVKKLHTLLSIGLLPLTEVDATAILASATNRHYPASCRRFRKRDIERNGRARERQLRGAFCAAKNEVGSQGGFAGDSRDSLKALAGYYNIKDVMFNVRPHGSRL